MRWKIWYSLPNNKNFCFTSRSCTSSIRLMAVKQFYPERIPDHPVIDGQGHRLNDYVVGEDLPDGCAVMVRDPVERFISLLWRMNISPEKAFCWLYWFHGLGDKPEYTDRHDLEYCGGTSWYHLTPVTHLINEKSKLFSFPDVAGMANYLEINTPIEKINFSKTTEKMILTPEQEYKVRTIYNNDISLWESLQN